MSKMTKPDYENCIANLPNSILKKFDAEPVGKTLPLLDPYLEQEYENIIVILLDGMGKAILERHLSEAGAFRSHLAGICKSTFLSTTVAATTSMMSGLQPCEHSWLGWDCYYPQVDKNVTVFLNVEMGTEIPAADYNIAWTYTPYENIIDRIKRHGGQAYMAAPFMDPELDEFTKLTDRVREFCKIPGKKYVYAYWNQPDGILHRKGCGSDETHENLIELEQEVAKLAGELKDSLIIVTADHGHIDNEQVMMRDYPQLIECLERMPSLEPRVLNLFVKPEKEAYFISEFNRLFGDRFNLMPMDWAIEANLFGTGRHHPMFRSMLGNYIAIATGDLSIMSVDEKFVSMHGSLTEDEMLIPLIVFET
ncbi:MAG: alkaline phosphatase family protein [Lachnospiraceae bacterium]|nr:alkaline phosphatase family protein [Lachnospiraceae bacterium]